MITIFSIQPPAPSLATDIPFVLPECASRAEAAMHVYRKISGTHHYHFGYFEDAREPLTSALERLALQVARRLPPGAILDVGCALGGTARLLAARGWEVTGLDPCAGALRAAARSNTGRAVRWVGGGLEDFAVATPLVFDGVVMIEVTQAFADLRHAMRLVRALVGPRGAVVVADVATVPRLAWDRVPFHRVGALAEAAERAGLRVVEQVDVTDRVTPTLPCLLEALQDTPCATPWDEVRTQLRHLEAGFGNGDLRYQLTVLRAKARP